jgi:hypothetical protein
MTGSISLLSPLRFVVAEPSRRATKPSRNLTGATRSTKGASMRIDDICSPLAIPRGDKKYWIAERTQDGSQVAYASACRYSTSRVEISFAVSPGFRHCGYGYELVASLVGHLETIPHIRTIVAVINYFNLYPQRIVLDLGFVRTAPSIYVKSLRTQTKA